MQIASGIAMLEIRSTIMGKISVIHPTLLYDGNLAILIDTGYPGQTSLIRDAMAGVGVSFEQLHKIIVTHQDVDHIGSLPAILSESPQTVEVLANELEKPFIQGEKPLLKYTSDAIEPAVQTLPTEIAEKLRASFKILRENPPKAKIDKTPLDAEVLPYCGGIVVINTPGHTPGHISLYHKGSKTLIAGDALRVEEGQLLGPDPKATIDINAAIKSLAKLKMYDIRSVICYHGGFFSDHVNERIATLCR